MSTPRIIGITGGIGSGKSTVARIFESIGVPLFQADDAAKETYAMSEVRAAVITSFGEDVFDGHMLNRKALAEKVFQNQQALSALNAIVHPAVRKLFQTWLAHQTAPYVLREAAIMIESNSYQDCAHIVLVRAPEELRIRRVMQRDNVTEEEVKARMQHQWTESQKLPFCDGQIINDGSVPLIPQVLEYHQHWLKA